VAEEGAGKGGEKGVASELAPTGWRGVAAELALDLAAMLRFYSRLPAPLLPFEAQAHTPPDFTRAPRMLPLAGLLIGLPGALLLWLGLAAGLSPLVAATLSVAAAVLACGAFHEDGLADSFDGLGGGWTRERRLEIMRDSRIGSYGASALTLALIARVACIAALAERGGGSVAALAVLGAAALSRPIGLMPLALLSPARPDGASALVGRPSGALFLLAIGLGFALALALGAAAGQRVAGATLGLALGLAAAAAMTHWAKRAVGGQTGDIAGACQQLAEIAFYVGLLFYLPDVESLAMHQRLSP